MYMVARIIKKKYSKRNRCWSIILLASDIEIEDLKDELARYVFTGSHPHNLICEFYYKKD